MFVYWQFIGPNGLDRRGEPKTALKKSKVHRLSPGLNTWTLCKVKIPAGSEVTRPLLATELPEGRVRCAICEAKA